MEGQKAIVGASDETPRVEPAVKIEATARTIHESEEKSDSLIIQSSADDEKAKIIDRVEAQPTSPQSTLASAEAASRAPSDARKTNDEERIEKSIIESGAERDSASDGIVKIESTCPNELRKDTTSTENARNDANAPLAENSKDKNPVVADKENFDEKTGKIAEEMRKIDGATNDAKIEISGESAETKVSLVTRIDEERDEATPSVDSMKKEENTRHEIFMDQSMVAELMPDRSCKDSTNEARDEPTIERTTEIIELVEYADNDKIVNSMTENSELIEIVAESSRNVENVNCEKIIEDESATSEENDARPKLETVHARIDENSIRAKNGKIIDVKFTKMENSEDATTLKNGESVSPEVSVSAIMEESTIEPTNDSARSSFSSPSGHATSKQRSVIEDIFEDWQDENPEDETSQQLSKSHDSVEMELKILLHDEKSMDVPCGATSTVTSETREKIVTDNDKSCAPSDDQPAKRLAKIDEASTRENVKRDGKSSEERRTEILPISETGSSVEARKYEKITDSIRARERPTKQKPLAPRPGVKVPGILLTSPIVSRSAVSKVLKERIREQQKDFDSPNKPDIFFVKKITQRLSHKLAAATAAQVPGLLPLSSQIGKSSTTTTTTTTEMTSSAMICETKKQGSGIDKELLAILEGDVDPDWSNLKTPARVEPTKASSTIITELNNPTKLDPTIERELALKQLLELPKSPGKKLTSKKITINKASSRSKTSKATCAKATTEQQASEKKNSSDETTRMRKTDATSAETLKDDFMDSSQSPHEYKNDETRSGRKRKPTEKAREHEISTKRLKIFKAKAIGFKRNVHENENTSSMENSSFTKNSEIVACPRDPDSSEGVKKLKVTDTSETEARKRTNDSISDDSMDSQSDVAAREFVEKKMSMKPQAKRKVITTGKKLMRQKLSSNKKSASLVLKSKFSKGIAKKSSGKLTAAGKSGPKQRGIVDNSHVEAKPKKKTINEIDRLLQDEGVVNLLYDVEQPDKKRLVPITKTATKVMDLQKIQRELKIRTKLVRNAVLRLRTSNYATSKVSPRSKRTISHPCDFYTEKRTSETKSAQSSSSTDFIYPAKIRNAADASIIIRRHSSSSFSSASASPRASIDGPERLSLDGGKFDDNGTASHLLRSNKRRCSQEDNEKMMKKKKKKQAQLEKESTEASQPRRNRRRISLKSEPESNDKEEENLRNVNFGAKCKNAVSASISTVEMSVPIVPISLPLKSKKIDSRKNQKAAKQQIAMSDVEEIGGGSIGKIATRSNGGTGCVGGKIMPKSKKSVRCKVTFAKGSGMVNKRMDLPGQQDELSVCLAEAVTALSNDSGGSSRCRSNIPVSRNKTKGNSSSLVKSFDNDEKKLKTESRVQFSNNEIIVQRHGKLVQLLLTPTTSTKIRNGITLQVMQEIRETLSLLKKDEECRVVLLTSTGTSFCEGLELSILLHDNKEERRLRAEELANAVKEFIKSLATFNKPIVAGVQGTAIGLGVTMLPWFDLVIASDKATFSTPYGKLGQIAEGAAVFTLSHILGSAVTSELLLGGRTLTANEALRAGLVTRVLWPDRFKDELLPSLRAMSEQSSQSMEATKALLRHSLRKKLDAALESESYLLIQHWCSAECQAAITAYVDEKIQ